MGARPSCRKIVAARGGCSHAPLAARLPAAPRRSGARMGGGMPPGPRALRRRLSDVAQGARLPKGESGGKPGPLAVQGEPAAPVGPGADGDAPPPPMPGAGALPKVPPCPQSPSPVPELAVPPAASGGLSVATAATGISGAPLPSLGSATGVTLNLVYSSHAPDTAARITCGSMTPWWWVACQIMTAPAYTAAAAAPSPVAFVVGLTTRLMLTARSR